tara:strand:+ start:574 stop:1038 length:465 start_codon:yes stop_codon:yes gene_type:complete
MLLKLLERVGRKRIIYDRVHNEPYLERYYLFLKERKSFPFNVFLHKFLKGDPDDVHDHPWPYATLILRGGYWEYTPVFTDDGSMVGEEKRWRGPGHFRTCQPNSYHRIELEPGITAWTLFMPGPHKREWGFLVKDKWVHNEQYLEGRRIHGNES